LISIDSLDGKKVSLSSREGDGRSRRMAAVASVKEVVDEEEALERRLVGGD